MDGKVIPIQGRLGSRKVLTPQERTRRAEQQAARIQFEEYVQIQKKMKHSPMMRKPERLRVAKNLWQILADLEKGVPPVPKRDVLYAAGQGSGTDSTKRLANFAVNPELSAEEQDKRASKLTQHINRYTKIVEAAAELSDGNAKVLIERLVEGTQYSWSPGDPESVEDLSLEGWGAIQERVREVSKEIDGNHDLQRFFGRVRELGIGVDSEGNFVQPAGRSEIYAAFQKLPALIRTDDLPPRPSVYLGEIRSAGDIPCTIRLEPYAGQGEAQNELFNLLKDSGLATVNFKGRVSLLLSCWLELLPLRKENIVTPVLRVTSRTFIKAAQTFDKFVAFGGVSFTKGETVFTPDGSLEDVGHDIMEAAVDEQRNSYAYYELNAELGRDPGDAYRKSLHGQIPFDHSLVGRFDDWARACLLNPALTEGLSAANCNYCAAIAEKMVELGLEHTDTLTYFRGGTMAARLERSLFDAPEPASLGRLLDERASKLVGKFDAAISDLKARRQFARLHIK
jgi:hypothetical protein